jgi:hypothetical protein
MAPVRRRPVLALPRNLLVLGVVLAAAALGPPPGRAAQSQSIHRKLSFSPADLHIVQTPAGARMVMNGALQLEDAGAPRLPFYRIPLVLPQGTRVAGVTATATGWTSLGAVPTLESAPPLACSDGGQVEVHSFAAAGAGAGAAAEPFPPVLARAAGSGVLHGYFLGAVEVFPVRVGLAGDVQLMTGCTLDVQLAPVDAGDVALRLTAWPGRADDDASQVRALVANPEQAAACAPPPGTPVELLRAKGAAVPGLAASTDQALAPELANLSLTGAEYVIVTTNALKTQFQRLADDKIARGVPAVVVTSEWILQNFRHGGDPQETIRGFLRNAYQHWGTRYVLLGGDTGVLPPRYARSAFYPQGGYTDIPTDLYFAALDGNWNKDADGVFGEAYTTFLDPGDDCDMLAELMVGRATVNTPTEVNVFINKALAYENPLHPSYVGRDLFLSEVLFPQNWDGISPPILDGAIYSEDIIFNKVLAPGNTVESFRLYENVGGYFGSTLETKGAAMDSMRTGHFGGVHHIGHGFYYNMSVGDLNIVAADADQLANAPNYFFLYALNCSSAAFDFDCLMERFLQNPNGGSAISIGSSRAAFPTTADRYQQGFYSEVFVAGHVHVGEAIMNSRAQYVMAANTVETSDRWTHFSYSLLGDPELSIWRNVPVMPSVTVPASITLGTASVSVDVSKSGQPVAGARITLRKAPEDYQSVVTAGGGPTVVPFRALTTGTIAITVTGPDLLQFASTIQVLPATAAHVQARAEVLDDNAVAPSIGDGDGIADAGETVEWGFRFTNNGSGASATAVGAVLRKTSAPGVTVLDSTIAVGTLAGAASVVPADRFVLALDPGVPDGTILTFRLVVSSGAKQWKQDVALVAYAPEVEVVRLTVDDATFGNGDGVIQAGENLRLLVQLRNFGGGTANVVTGTLSTLSPDVSLLTAVNTWGPLALKQVSTGAGSFKLAESNVAVENTVLLTLADERGHVWSHSFELRPPSPPDAPQLDTAVGTTSIAVRCETPYQPHFYGFRVYRAVAATGPFQEVTEDPVVGSGFLRDDGLQQLTKYYYCASVVDSSRIESSKTAAVSASTSPAELAGGFPKDLAIEVAGHVAVGDIQGNGSLCAVVGSNDVYAFKSNGEEIVDGDGDSQTLGPISALGDKFTPSGITLGDLDGDGALEIIGSSWNTNQIYVFRGDGSVYPGWPQTMNNKNWATPAVGDLDHDGIPEIVVNNVGANTYVWHRDGTEFRDGDNNPATLGIFQARPGETFNRSSPALFDVDGDGKLEIIFGTNYANGTNNRIHCLRNNGQDAPGWPRYTGTGGAIVSSPTVADLNHDGIPEIFVVAENDSLHVLEPNGQNFPGFPKSFLTTAWELDSLTPSPAVGDFDHDGKLEMVVVSVVSIHESKIYLMDYTGTVRPGWPRSLPGLSESSPVVADINGDQQLDIVFGIGGGSDNDPSQLCAFNRDGTDISGFPIAMGGAPRSAPTICDFDGDGKVDIVLAGFDRKLHVWSMPFPYNPYLAPWPTFRGNAYRTGVFRDHPTVGLGGDGLPAGRAAPARLTMLPNVPNPFNPSTSVRFEVPATSSGMVEVRVDVVDVAGRHIRTLLAEQLSAGAHAVRWDGRDDHGGAVGSGVYFAHVTAAGESQSLKMTLAK